MKYEFNTSRFAKLIKDGHLEYRATARKLGISDNGTVQRWEKGKVISTEHLLNICSTFDINPAEFILCDKQPLLTQQEGKSANTANSTDTQLALMQQQNQHLQAVADLEKAHIRELMQKDIDLAKKEASIREEIRREMRDEYESQIATLRNQLLDLTAQYRELELTARSYSNITAVADNKGSNCIEKK